MTITDIQSNGSKWAGQPPDDIDTLLSVLGENPLDRGSEDYGNFVTSEGEGFFHFFGNFFTVSHVFSIRTNDAALVEKLTAAIRVNQQRPDYKSQHKPKPFADAKRRGQ